MDSRGLCDALSSNRHSTLSESMVADAGETKPLQRLLSLLRAESTDIWVIVIFALISGLLMMTTPLAVEALVNTVAFGRFLQPVIVLSLMLLAFLLFQAALKAIQTCVVEIIQRRLFARVAAELSFRLPRTRVEALDDKYAPELVNRFFDIASVQKISAQLLLDGISLVLNVAVGMTVLAFYHPYLLAFDVVLVISILLTMFVLGHGAVKTSIKESKTKYAMAAWLEDLARCRTAFRYDGAAEFAMERSDQLIYDYLMAQETLQGADPADHFYAVAAGAGDHCVAGDRWMAGDFRTVIAGPACGRGTDRGGGRRIVRQAR